MWERGIARQLHTAVLPLAPLEASGLLHKLKSFYNYKHYLFISYIIIITIPVNFEQNKR